MPVPREIRGVCWAPGDRLRHVVPGSRDGLPVRPRHSRCPRVHCIDLCGSRPELARSRQVGFRMAPDTSGGAAGAAVPWEGNGCKSPLSSLLPPLSSELDDLCSSVLKRSGPHNHQTAGIAGPCEAPKPKLRRARRAGRSKAEKAAQVPKEGQDRGGEVTFAPTGAKARSATQVPKVVENRPVWAQGPLGRFRSKTCFAGLPSSAVHGRACVAGPPVLRPRACSSGASLGPGFVPPRGAKVRFSTQVSEVVENRPARALRPPGHCNSKTGLTRASHSALHGRACAAVPPLLCPRACCSGASLNPGSVPPRGAKARFVTRVPKVVEDRPVRAHCPQGHCSSKTSCSRVPPPALHGHAFEAGLLPRHPLATQVPEVVENRPVSGDAAKAAVRFGQVYGCSRVAGPLGKASGRSLSYSQGRPPVTGPFCCRPPPGLSERFSEFGFCTKVSFSSWCGGLLRSVLRTRTPFAAFLRSTLHLPRLAKPAPPSGVVFPIPLPFAGVFACFPLGHSSRTRRRIMHQRLLHIVCMALNFLHSDFVPIPLSVLQRPLNAAQRSLVAHVSRHLKAFGASVGEFVLSDSGRRNPQLLARLSELSRFLSLASASTGATGDTYADRSGTVVPMHNDAHPGLDPFKALDVSRLRLSGRGLWDPVPYLPDELYMAFVEPRSLAHPVPPPDSFVPVWSRECPKETASLAALWDSLGLLRLAPADTLATDSFRLARAFNCYKAPDRDRMIIDRRGQNWAEARLAGPSLFIPVGPMIGMLEVNPRHQSLFCAAADRKDFYHQFKAPEGKSVTNALGPALPAHLVSNLQAFRRPLRRSFHAWPRGTFPSDGPGCSTPGSLLLTQATIWFASGPLRRGTT